MVDHFWRYSGVSGALKIGSISLTWTVSSASVSKYMMSWGLTKFTAMNQGLAAATSGARLFSHSTASVAINGSFFNPSMGAPIASPHP